MCTYDICVLIIKLSEILRQFYPLAFLLPECLMRFREHCKNTYNAHALNPPRGGGGVH